MTSRDSSRDVSRRDFVAVGAAAGAASIVPSGVARPAPFFRERQEAQEDEEPVDVACIGVGGMGLNDVRGVDEAGFNVVALCDVDQERAEEAYTLHPDARRYTDWRELLAAETEVPAVTVSTPDHTHAVITMAALKEGKHVYTQKPLVRTLGEARAVRAEAARRPDQVTQMGNQGHAQDGVRLMREWVEEGLLGEVREVHYWTNRPIWPQGTQRPTDLHVPRPSFDWDLWLGPARERPYNPAYAPFRWRGWWDFGTGALGDMACHLMDAAYWILGLGYPERVEAECSQVYDETAPESSRVVYRYPARDGRGPVRIVWRDGGLVPRQPEEWPDHEPWPPSSEGGQLWLGTEGKMTAGTYSQDPRLLDADLMEKLEEDPLEELYPRTDGVYSEWIEAIRSGEKAGSDFATYAAGFTEMVLVGCLAQRLRTRLEVDPDSGEILSDVPAAFVDPPYRDGWSL